MSVKPWKFGGLKAYEEKISNERGEAAPKKGNSKRGTRVKGTPGLQTTSLKEINFGN